MRACGRRPRISGFTLIELMIVVSIIGVLAAIAIPKFAELIRKSHEGKTKASLGAIRSALAIYYSDNQGVYPGELPALTVGGKYFTDIPKVMAAGLHPETSVVAQTVGTNALGCAGAYAADTGELIYWNDDDDTGTCAGFAPPAGSRRRLMGEAWVGCLHTDMRGSFWTSY